MKLADVNKKHKGSNPMKFKVFFQANGVAVINAKSQAEAETKAKELTDEQIAEAIDSVTVTEVVKAGKGSGRTAD